ncbi:MAG: hypothetical protein ACFFCM_15465 [Promethearchaeota archaeon]
MEKIQIAGLTLPIVGLVTFLICLFIINTYSSWPLDSTQYTAWDQIMNWNFLYMDGMILIPAFIFFIIGIILMIIGLIFLIVGLLRAP